MTTVARLRELMAKATQGRWEHIKRDITLDAVHCLGDPVAVRLYAADAALIVAAINALPALLAVAEAAAVVSSQRNGPYLMADMDATMEAENVLKRALEGLNNNEKEMA